MKKIFAILSAIVTGVLLSPIAIIAFSAALTALLIPVNMLLNNANLRTFEHNFAAIVHPLSSASRATLSRFGNLSGGSSDFCDYFAGNLRSTPIPRNAIVSHYAETSIASPASHTGNHTDVRLWFFGEETHPPEPSLSLLFSEPKHWGIDPSEYTNETLYVAYALETGTPPGLDIRCQ